MSEALHGVAKTFTRWRYLLSAQSNVISVLQEIFKHCYGPLQGGLVEFADSGQGFDAPQSAKTESTLLSTDAVVRLGCVVAVNEVVGRKTTTLWTFQYCIQGTPEAGIRRRSKEHERHDEHSRIQDVDVVVTLCEKLLFRVPCLLHYLLVQLIACIQPLIAPRTRERALIREAEASVDRHPYTSLVKKGGLLICSI